MSTEGAALVRLNYNAIFNLRPEVFYMDISKQGSKMAYHLLKLQTTIGCLQVARQITLVGVKLFHTVDKPSPVNTLFWHFISTFSILRIIWTRKMLGAFLFVLWFPHRALNSKQQRSCSFCPELLTRTLRIISTPDYKTM